MCPSLITAAGVGACHKLTFRFHYRRNRCQAVDEMHSSNRTLHCRCKQQHCWLHV